MTPQTLQYAFTSNNLNNIGLFILLSAYAYNSTIFFACQGCPFSFSFQFPSFSFCPFFTFFTFILLSLFLDKLDMKASVISHSLENNLTEISEDDENYFVLPLLSETLVHEASIQPLETDQWKWEVPCVKTDEVKIISSLVYVLEKSYVQLSGSR